MGKAKMKAVILFALAIWYKAVEGFTLHIPSAIPSRGAAVLHPTSRAALPFPGMMMDQQSTLVIADAVDIAKNAVIGVGTIVALLFGAALFFSSVVIPKAAEQLEMQAKELDPELWAEYEAKMEPGEVLAVRPDLLQELGEKVRARMVEKFEEAELRQQNQAENKSSEPSAVLEAEIVSKDSKKE